MERRTLPRVSFTGKAYLTYDGRCRCEDVVDVSPDGLFVRSSARLQPGDPVKVFLPLQVAGAWRLCLLKADVVRRVRGKGLALQLRDGEIDTRNMLADYVTAAA